MSARAGFRAIAAALGLFLIAGCGGRGGGGDNTSSTESNQSTGRESCALTTYTPNYASGITLTYWPQFPLHIYFDTASASYTPDLQARALTAFDGWVNQSGGQVAYVVVNDLAEADINVGFVPLTNTALSSYDADGITYFYGPSSTNTTGDADSQFGYVRIYVGINGQETRENGTMGHEFGHALGIHGHSPNGNDLMYYTWTSSRSQTPTTRDINTLDTAYCGIFSRAEAAKSGRNVTVNHPAMPPLSAPGWVAIP